MTPSARQLSVKDAADQTGVTVYTLHYYEREGLLRTSRTQSGHRRYAESDLGWIRILTCLRQTGMPIRKMREFAALVQQDQTNIPANIPANIEARIRMLEEHRSDVLTNIAELGRNLEHVEGKIRHYRQALLD
jgi:DNA-binding transcriptional MerR regulator